MPLLEAKQGTDAWRAAREGKITASLAPACLGLSPWTSRQKAWRIIKGIEKTQVDNRHTAWGKEFEPAAISSYEVESGNLVKPTGFWEHPTIPWLGASPDGLIGEYGLVEVKCPSKIHTEVPEHYEVQMRVQMACCRREWCDFFSWNQCGNFLKRVGRDAAKELSLIVQLLEFWDTYVVADVEPPRAKRKVAV